jgi:hypothetical protein
MSQSQLANVRLELSQVVLSQPIKLRKDFSHPALCYDMAPTIGDWLKLPGVRLTWMSLKSAISRWSKPWHTKTGHTKTGHTKTWNRKTGRRKIGHSLWFL